MIVIASGAKQSILAPLDCFVTSLLAMTKGVIAIVPIAAAACAAAPSAAAIEAGQRAYQKCYSCHALEAGRNDLTGPTLYGIVGRRVAAEPGFDYSPALRRFAEGDPVWTPELIDRFAADPEALVPGTTMAFHGMADAQERAALIAFLKSLQP